MKLANLVTSIDPSLGGGVAEVVNKLSLEISKSAKVNVYSLIHRSGRQKSFRLNDNLNYLLYKYYDPFLYGFSPNLKQNILQSDADVLHVHGMWEYNSFIALNWFKLKNKPYIISPHGMLNKWSLKSSSLKKKLLLLIIERKYLKNASLVHALNLEEYDQIRDIGLKNPVCIIPNGVNLPNDESINTPNWFNMIPKYRKNLLYLGRLHPKKNIQSLIIAYYNYSQTNTNFLNDWNLIIAGWDQLDYKNKLLSMIKEFNLANNVFLIGPQYGTDKVFAYKNADAFILPSFDEGLPMAVLEAWSYSLPVLMTKECNLNIGFEKGAAINIKCEIDGIMEGLNKLQLLSNVELKQIGILGRSLVEKEFVWEIIAQKWLETYNWLINGGIPPYYIKFN